MGNAVATTVHLSREDVAPATVGKRQTGLAPAATERLREPRHDGDERAAPREREHVIGLGAVRGDRMVNAPRLGVQGALDEPEFRRTFIGASEHLLGASTSVADLTAPAEAQGVCP